MEKSITTLKENLDKLFENSKLIELVNYSENERDIEEYLAIFKKFFNLNYIDLFKTDFESKKIDWEDYSYFRNSVKIQFNKKEFKEEEIRQIYFFIKFLKEDNYNINYTWIELQDLEKYFEEIDCSNWLCKAKQQFVFELDNILSNPSISIKNHIIALINEFKVKISNIQKELENNSITIKNILAWENKIDEFIQILDNFISEILKTDNEQEIISLIKNFSTNQKTINFFVKSKISNLFTGHKKVKWKEIIDDFIKTYKEINLFYSFWWELFKELRENIILLYQSKLKLLLAWGRDLKENIEKSIEKIEKIKKKIEEIEIKDEEKLRQVPEFKSENLTITF